MLVGSSLIRQQNDPSGTEIGIGVIQDVLIVGREKVLHRKLAASRSRQPQDRVTVIRSALIGVERTVAGSEIHSRRIGGGTSTTLPNSCLTPVGRQVQDTCLLQFRLVVGHNPHLHAPRYFLELLHTSSVNIFVIGIVRQVTRKQNKIWSLLQCINHFDSPLEGLGQRIGRTIEAHMRIAQLHK